MLLSHLMSKEVLLSRYWISLTSSSSRKVFSMSISSLLSIVSKAALMSMPVMSISSSNFWTRAAKKRCTHTTSEVLIFCLYALCDFERKLFTFVWILFSTMFERTFLIVGKIITGRKFLTGPRSLPGLGSAARMPFPSSICSRFSKMLLIDWISYFFVQFVQDFWSSFKVFDGA